jgi:hypothetical protein
VYVVRPDERVATMENPYLEKVTRAVDERVGRPSDELQALALVAIAIELQAIRRHLEGDVPPPVAPMAARRVVLDEVSDGIVVG